MSPPILQRNATGERLKMEDIREAPSGRAEDDSIVQIFRNAGFESSEVETLVASFGTICRSLEIGTDSQALRNLVALKVVDLAVRGERDPARISIAVVADLRESVGTEPSDRK
jgi:hypothetical protein